MNHDLKYLEKSERVAALMRQSQLNAAAAKWDAEEAEDEPGKASVRPAPEVPNFTQMPRKSGPIKGDQPDPDADGQFHLGLTVNGVFVGPTPAGPADRKGTPLYSGVLAYFPDALQAVAQLSKFGNDKHNPGEPLHWSRGKSNDHKDCIARHLLDAGTVDPETGMLHDVALAWRALANLQIELEKRKSA